MPCIYFSTVTEIPQTINIHVITILYSLQGPVVEPPLRGMNTTRSSIL